MKLACALLLGALGVGSSSAAWAQCAGCFGPSFADTIRAYPALANLDLAAADFDGDGTPDLVVAAGEKIAFLRGSGTGAFAPPVSFVSAGSNAITTADFNGDGHADVATSGTNVSIFLGNGGGSFQPPIEYTPDFAAFTFIAAGELTGDGIPDLVATAFDPTWVRIYVGQGDGTFAPPLQIPGPLPQGLALGDFDGNGLTDIAVSGFSPGSIGVYLNDGHGGFSDERLTSLGGSGSLVPGDFNGDGRTDLAQARFSDIVVLLANGDGTFAQSDMHAVNGGTSHAVVEDFDRDGVLDLSFASDQAGTVTRMHGNGDGTFGPEVVTPAGDQLGQLVSADFDGNGWPDLAVRTYPTVEILLTAPGGGFPAPPTFATGALSNEVVAGDFMGSGHVDLATNAAVILPGLGNGSLDGPVPLTIAGAPIQVAAGSFAPGGGLDLAILTNAGIEIALSNGDGTFQVLAPFGSASFLAPADFDGDGKLDLAWLGGADLHVAKGNGDGTFGAEETYAGLGGDALTVGRFDAGATPDVAITTNDHYVVMLGNGDGTFTQGVTSPLWYWSLSRITSGDFDDDGHDDIAIALWGGDPQAFLYWGNGDGTFEDPATVASSIWVQRLFPADVNGDGTPELVLSGIQAVHILTFLPDRSSVSWEAVKPNIGAATALADLYEDGRPDLALVGGATSLAQIYRNTGCEARRLRIATQAESCNDPGQAFGTQPVLQIVDDGDNVVTCETGTVTAALEPAPGSAGASLGGTTAVAAVAGVATFTDLSIDLPGRGYRLSYSHLLTAATLGRTMSQGLDVGIVGPAAVCSGDGAAYRVSDDGWDRVQWTLDGADVSRAELVAFAGLPVGVRNLGVTVYADGCAVSASRGVLVQAEPVEPVIIAPPAAEVGETGLVASVAQHDSSLYHWTVTGGTLTSGQGTHRITFDAGPPGTTMRLTVVEQTFTDCISPVASADVQVDFTDVGPQDPLHDPVAVMARRGITAGCGGGMFCPHVPMTRAQAAVLLLKAKHGADFQPWPASGVFFDVPPGSFAADWIERLVSEGITAGCGDGNFCPNDPVTRAQAAVWLLKSEHGSDFVPPACEGVFADVACAPPAFAVDWIEALYGEGITGGCGTNPLVFCPASTVTRGQAAAMIVRTFNLQ